MDIQKTIEKIEISKVFLDWQKKNQGFYLVHVFLMSNHNPQVGYYNDKLDKITTFDLGQEVILNPPSDVFKEGKTIPKLKLENIKIDLEKARQVIIELKKSTYSAEVLEKEIILLQEFDGETVYNFTYFTKAFKTLNIKVNASNGKIISHELSSLLSM